MLGYLRGSRVSVRVERPDPDEKGWEAFGVDPAEVRGWDQLGFDAFGAALAHGDGFTPMNAAHYRRPLRKTADRWRTRGLASAEGLRWHRAGFAAREATRWRSEGIDIETARGLRAGYLRRGAVGGQLEARPV